MHTMFVGENWAKLYKGQLMLSNGKLPDNWGFSCIFLDDRFNKLFKKKYSEINRITGSHFHIFSFVEPSRLLINDRIALLNDRYRNKDIEADIYYNLKSEFEKLRDGKKNDQDMSHERNIIIEQIMKANKFGSKESLKMDIIVFDFESLKSGVKEIPAFVLNTSFKEDDLEEMMRFIVRISEYAKTAYIENNTNKDVQFYEYLQKECNRMKQIILAGHIISILKSVKEIFV